MRFVLTLFILAGCAYKDQPPEIQKLKITKIQSDQSLVEKETKEKEEKSIDENEEVEVVTNQPKWDNSEHQRIIDTECVDKVLGIKTSQSFKVGTVNGECIYYSMTTDKVYTYEELINKFQ